MKRPSPVWALLAAASIGTSAPATAQDAERVQVTISTELGPIVVELDAGRAPVTVENFLRYVDGGTFAEGAVFHRVVRDDNQQDDPVKIDVIQASPGRGAQPRFPPIELERTRATGLRHLDGTISMARGGPDTATSSFFICVGDQPELDYGGARNPDGQGFAAFGRVVSGMDVVRAIHRAPADGQTLGPPIAIEGIERGTDPSAPATPRASVQDRPTWHFAGVDFPPTIDSFVVLGVDRWPDPARGAVLHLATELAPRVSVDVHVHPAAAGRLDDEALRAEFTAALSELGSGGGRSDQVAVDTVYTTSAVAGGFTYLGHRADATIRRAGGVRYAILQVFPRAPSFIRVRAIYDRESAPVVDRRLDALVTAILERVHTR